MTATMTKPVDMWTDANREEIDFENRMAMEDARAEWEHREAIRDFAESTGAILRAMLSELAVTHPLLRDRRSLELQTEFAANKGTLELMTGETWPEKLPEFLCRCDRVVKAAEEMAA